MPPGIPAGHGYNLGAIVRSVAAFGGHGVFMTERRAAGMGDEAGEARKRAPEPAGGGARRSGEPITVSPIEEPTRALIGTGLPFKDSAHIARYLETLPGLTAHEGFPTSDEIAVILGISRNTIYRKVPNLK